MLKRIVILFSSLLLFFSFLGEHSFIYASVVSSLDYSYSYAVGSSSDYEKDKQYISDYFSVEMFYNSDTIPLVDNNTITCKLNNKDCSEIAGIMEHPYFKECLSNDGFVKVTFSFGYYVYNSSVKRVIVAHINGVAVYNYVKSSISFNKSYTDEFQIECSNDFDLNNFVNPIKLSSNDFGNYKFSGYRFSPSGDTPLNAYGHDVTIGFNIPCSYPGLDGVLGTSRDSLLKDKIVDTIKKTSVLTFNGKKLNIPKNKISVHFYEPTIYDTIEEKQKYGFYTLSDKGPYSLYSDGDGRLRGTIIIFTGNIPQVNGNATLQYSSDFVDGCSSKYFSFKGYEFKSNTYSCETIQKYTAVVDSDGDGVDDNTGITVGDKYDNNGNHTLPGEEAGDEPNRSDYEDGILGLVQYVGDLIVYWIKSPFIAIGNVFSTLINSANESLGWFGEFGEFFGSFFSFLPDPIQTCMFAIISATTISIILAMFFKR